MYGVEAQASGGGGLAARTPYAVSTYGADRAISPTASVLAGGPSNGQLLPYQLGSEGVALPVVGAGGRAVDKPSSIAGSSWREIMDWHSSPALWVLIMILALYAWLHVSIHASVRAGR